MECVSDQCRKLFPDGAKFCPFCGTQQGTKQNSTSGGIRLGDVGYHEGDITDNSRQGAASVGSIHNNPQFHIHVGREQSPPPAAQGEGAIGSCQICGRRNRVVETFDCVRCGKQSLCLSHQDGQYHCCHVCAGLIKGHLALDEGDFAGAEKILKHLLILAPESRHAVALQGDIRRNQDEAAERQRLARRSKALEAAVRRAEEERIRQAQQEALARQRREEEERQKQPQAGEVWTEPVTGMEFVFVPGGCYQMGDTFDDGASEEEEPVHEVCVDSFRIGKYEVTQGQWESVMGNNPSEFNKGSNYPVETVSWDDAQQFIQKLNAKSGKKFRLPTEAEWEYAARSGGKNEKYAGGNDEDRVAWHSSNSGNTTHPVGSKSPNGLEIYDMSGNVWEWCQDWFEEEYYASSPRNNPQGPSSGAEDSGRVLRGGCWDFDPWYVRSASRGRSGPAHRLDDIGFRLVLPVQ